jgi:hypothetical protein
MKDVQRIEPSPGIVARPASADSRADFKQSFAQRFVVRFHMTLILAALGASGVLVSKVLLELGVRSMLSRYLIAVVVSYALFFLFIRLWLLIYVSPSRPKPRSRSVDVGDALDIGDFALDVGGKSVASGNEAFGGGGDFGGGGATDVWVGDTGSPIISTPSSVGGSGGGSGGFDFDIDGEGIVVLIVLALLLVVIFGAGAYLVYAAPEILSEAAFEALLAAGLIKASKKMDGPGWMGSVFKATWIPFVIVLILTGIFGWVAQTHYPHATRLADIFKKPAPEGRQLPSSR